MKMINHLALAALATGCALTGKTLGAGSSPTSSGGGGGGVPTSSMTMDERRGLHAPDEGFNTGLPSYASAPADPWLAVENDQPKHRPRDKWTVRDTPGECSAAHDHCLEPDTWFLVQNADLTDKGLVVTASVALFGPEGPLYADNARGKQIRTDFIAFHTVPATKANLAPGAIAFGIQRPDGVPTNGTGAVLTSWHYGVVESVDLELGVYKLTGDKDTMMLPGARVAVLRWVPGGKVEILGGRARNQLAVAATDVFLPET